MSLKSYFPSKPTSNPQKGNSIAITNNSGSININSNNSPINDSNNNSNNNTTNDDKKEKQRKSSNIKRGYDSSIHSKLWLKYDQKTGLMKCKYCSEMKLHEDFLN